MQFQAITNQAIALYIMIQAEEKQGAIHDLKVLGQVYWVSAVFAWPGSKATASIIYPLHYLRTVGQRLYAACYM